jgi:hypothetical protein
MYRAWNTPSFSASCRSLFGKLAGYGHKRRHWRAARRCAAGAIACIHRCSVTKVESESVFLDNQEIV